MAPQLDKVQWVNLDGWRLGLVEEVGNKSKRYRVTTFNGAQFVEPSDLVYKPTAGDHTDRFKEKIQAMGLEDGRRTTETYRRPKTMVKPRADGAYESVTSEVLDHDEELVD